MKYTILTDRRGRLSLSTSLASPVIDEARDNRCLTQNICRPPVVTPRAAAFAIFIRDNEQGLRAVRRFDQSIQDLQRLYTNAQLPFYSSWVWRPRSAYERTACWTYTACGLELRTCLEFILATLVDSNSPEMRKPLLPTALAEKIKKQPVASVCPSVCFNSVFWTDWPLNLSLCVCRGGHDHNMHGIESQG